MNFAQAQLPADVVAKARAIAAESRRNAMQVLEEVLGLQTRLCVERVSTLLAIETLDMHGLAELAPDFSGWAFSDAKAHGAFVAQRAGQWLGVLSDPFDPRLQMRLETRSGHFLHWVLASHGDVAAYLVRLEEGLLATEDMALNDAAVPDAGLEDISIASIAGDTSPVIRLVNSVIYDAMRVAASDIHMETGRDGLEVKIRVDGVLSRLTSVEGVALADQVVSRVKVLSDLDIGERRIPQDGRFKLSVRGREVDFRVSIMPSLFGEDVVIRILDKQALTKQFEMLSLDLLGFSGETLAQIRRLSQEPYGMVLVTGPTGSGKTTTLYAALSEIHTGEEKIITIEDPVEYQLPGILQIPVNEKKGLGFARGLRSILRHDPDKILVGEIRDPETAQIAIQSALTGHLVLTSVHANNVFDVIGRFLHMGVDPHSFVSCLNGVVAQRLIRVVCEECAQPDEIAPQQLSRSSIDPDAASGARRGAGCGSCRGSGYRGRIAIGEVLIMHDGLRELLSSRAPISEIKTAARESGTRFLRDAAVDLFTQGRTTLDEVNRITFVS